MLMCFHKYEDKQNESAPHRNLVPLHEQVDQLCGFDDADI